MRIRENTFMRKSASRAQGFVLVEAMISLSILTILGLVLLKMSMNVLVPRQWTMQQSVSDAYMTYERALAERVPFDRLVAAGSLWPIGAPAFTELEIGQLPSITGLAPGVPIRGEVRRSRFADPDNYPADGGTPRPVIDSVRINPAAMKIWRLQSVLTYRIGNQTYAKSRTVTRSQ